MFLIFTYNLQDGSFANAIGDLRVSVEVQFDELQEAYLLRRRQVASKQRQKQLREPVIEKDVCKDADNYYAGLDDFQSMLTAYTRYR